MKDFEILRSEYINKHIYFTARKDAYKTPDGKIVDPYFVVELPMSVCALVITEHGKVIFVEQYRHPLQKKLLELPGGFVDAGETPEVAIGRELLEETGHQFDDIRFLASTAANPGVLNNYTQLFLCRGGRKVSGQSLDPNEEIELKFYSIEDARVLLEQNKIEQSMHALCMFYAFQVLDAEQ